MNNLENLTNKELLNLDLEALSYSDVLKISYFLYDRLIKSQNRVKALTRGIKHLNEITGINPDAILLISVQLTNQNKDTQMLFTALEKAKNIISVGVKTHCD